MYIIIAGCRKVGSNLALSLAQLNHDVVIIDSDPSNFEALGSGFNGVTITGVPIDEDILRSAGIEQADCLAAVTNDDNMNMMISRIASQIFHVPQVLTRVYDPRRDAVFRQMGLTTLCPTSLAVERIKDYLLKSSESVSHEFFGTDILFTSVKPNKKQIGKQIFELADVSIFGLLREGAFLLARPDIIVEVSDTLILSDYAS